MTTHLLKPGLLISGVRTRCGVPLTGKTKVRKGDMLGSEDGICNVDCAGCLRDLIVDMRLQAAGALPSPGQGDPTAENAWRAGGDTGTSSLTIWSVMTGRPVTDDRGKVRAGVPLDPSDFGRCHRLLERFPAWRERMPEVSAAHPEWTALVAEWEALTALYLEELPTGKGPKLYARMQTLLQDGAQ